MAATSKPKSAANGASAAPTQISLVDYGSGKPDRVLFDEEQERIKRDISALQAKMNVVKDKIGLTSKGGSGNDRRTQLRSELDTIRSQQSENKYSRAKVLDQLKQIQEGIQKKIKDLNAAKSKTKFKTVAEVDDRISALQRQVDSGNMKLADEKRALYEITQTRRTRRAVENFQSEQESIDRDRETEEEIRKQLDDPEAKAISERFDAIKAELDELKKEGDEAFANRSKLMDERSSLQTELDVLYNLKRESAQMFKDANDKHWAKISEDRARRAEKLRAQRAADEDSKKQELITRLREEASEPAYRVEIEDCGTLIDYFSKGTQTSEASSTSLADKAIVAGVPELDIRKIDASAADGLIVRKKKGEEEETYFIGGRNKKGKKGGPKTNGSAEPAAVSVASQLNMPLAILSALLSLSIPPPSSTAEVPRVVEDLKTKKAWFEANQARVTRERIAKAEADIRKLTGGNITDVASKEADPRSVQPPNDVEASPEPAPVPQKNSAADSTEDVVEHAQEEEETAKS